MSLLSTGLMALGWMLGGLVLLVIFGLAAMAQQGDAYLEQLEFILSQRSRRPARPQLRLVKASQSRTLTRS